MTPLNQSDAELDEKTKLLRPPLAEPHGGSKGYSSSSILNRPFTKHTERPKSSPVLESTISSKSREDGITQNSDGMAKAQKCEQYREDIVNVTNAKEKERSLLQADVQEGGDSGWRRRFNLLSWSKNSDENKHSGTLIESPTRSPPIIAAMANLEEGFKFQFAKVKSKVNLKWLRRQDTQQDEDFKKACADDLNKRTRDKSFGIHAQAPATRSTAALKPQRSKSTERDTTAIEQCYDSQVDQDSQSIEPKNLLCNKYTTKSPSEHQMPHAVSSTNIICTPSSTNNQSYQPNKFISSEERYDKSELHNLYHKENQRKIKNVRKYSTHSENEINDTTKLIIPRINTFLRSESADYDTVRTQNGRNNFRPPLARAASEQTCSSDKSNNSEGHNLYSFGDDQRPKESKSFFSIEYLKANFKLDLKVPNLPFPVSSKEQRIYDTNQQYYDTKKLKGENDFEEKYKKDSSNDSMDSYLIGDDEKSERNCAATVIMESRQTMTEGATATISRLQSSSRIIRLGGLNHEHNRGVWTRPSTTHEKSTTKITQRKPKHPPQNIRRSPLVRRDLVMVETTTQTSPVTVQMIDLGNLASPPGHPDFDQSHRPWHASSTASGLWSPRGPSGSVENLFSDEQYYDESSDTSVSPLSPMRDFQVFRQLSPITEADYSSDYDRDEIQSSIVVSKSLNGLRNRSKEMMKHKSFQNVQNDDSPSSREHLNQMSPSGRHRSESRATNNLLTIPDTIPHGTLPQAHHAPSLKHWKRACKSAGSFSNNDALHINDHASAQSRSFDTSLIDKNRASIQKEHFDTQDFSTQSIPKPIHKSASSLTVDYYQVHRSHTDSHLVDFDDEDNSHEPLFRKRSDSVAMVQSSKSKKAKKSPEARRREHRHSSSRSPSSDETNGRRRRNSPKIENQHSDSSSRSPETRRSSSDQKHSSRSPSSDEMNGRRRRNSARPDDSKKTRGHLSRQPPTFSHSLWVDDGLGLKWFDVDDDFTSVSSYSLSAQSGNKKARSFDDSSPPPNTNSSDIKSQNSSLSPRHDDKKRARSFDSSSTNNKRHSLVPRETRHNHVSNPNLHYKDSVNTGQMERKSPKIKKKRRKEALSPLITISRSFDDRFSVPDSPCKESQRARRATGSLSQLNDHFSSGDSVINEKSIRQKSATERNNKYDKGIRRSKAVELCEGRGIIRNFSDDSNQRFVPLERQDKPRRVSSAPSECSPPPSPLYPTVQVVPPPESGTTKYINIFPCQSDINEENDHSKTISSTGTSVSSPHEKRCKSIFCCGPSPPVINIDIPEAYNMTSNRDAHVRALISQGQQTKTDANCNPSKCYHHSCPQHNHHCHHLSQSAIDKSNVNIVVEQRSFEEPSSRASQLHAYSKLAPRRAASFSFSTPLNDSHDKAGGECETDHYCESRGYTIGKVLLRQNVDNSCERYLPVANKCESHFTSSCIENKNNNPIDYSTNNNSESLCIRSPYSHQTCTDIDKTIHKDSITTGKCCHHHHHCVTHNSNTHERIRVTRSLTDSDCVQSVDHRWKTCNGNGKVTSFDSNPLFGHNTSAVLPTERNAQQSFHCQPSVSNHMTGSSCHVTVVPDHPAYPKCALHGECGNELSPSSFAVNSTTKSARSRSYDVSFGRSNHKDSLTESCSVIRKVINNRKVSSPAGSYNCTSNNNCNSNNNLLSIPVWNSALNKFSCSDSTLAEPSKTDSNCIPLKKTSSVPPSFQENEFHLPSHSKSVNSVSPSSSSLSSTPAQFSEVQTTFRQHSADECVPKKNCNCFCHCHTTHHHPQYNAFSSHSSPHINTLTPSTSVVDNDTIFLEWERHQQTNASTGRCHSLHEYDRYFNGNEVAVGVCVNQHHSLDLGQEITIASSKFSGSSPCTINRARSQELFGRQTTETYCVASDQRLKSTPGPFDSLAPVCQQTQQTELHAPKSGEDEVLEDVETTPLLSPPMAGAVDGRGIEIIVSDENDARVSTVQTGKRAVFRRIWMVLLDNRMAGRPDCEHALRPHPEEYQTLKRILNIVFVTVGVALLISVFVVIIYTYVGKYKFFHLISLHVL